MEKIWYTEKDGQSFTVMKYMDRDLGWTEGTCLYWGKIRLAESDFSPENLAAQRHGGRFIYIDHRLSISDVEDLMKEPAV